MEAQTKNWLIPLWVKAAIAFFALSMGSIFLLSLLSDQTALFGLPTSRIASTAMGLTLFLVAVSAAFWFFPKSSLTLFLYWLVRFARELISVFALLGMVYLLTIRLPLVSFRGGIPFLIFSLMFLLGLLVPPVGLYDCPIPWLQNIFVRLGKVVERINVLPAIIPALVVAFLPLLILLVIIHGGMGSSISNYGPYSAWRDEASYWSWIRSFSEVGLNAGYNAANELIPRAAFNHYGEGSPIYIYIYGSIARLIGWSSQTPILINLLILFAAVLLFIFLTRLEPVQIIFTGLVLVLTWPILYYLPMTTHETLNQVIGFVLGIVFFRLLAHREQVGLRTRIFCVFLVYLAALTRLSWGLFLVPVIFYSLEGSILRRALVSLLLGAAFFLSVILITNYVVPPTNNSIFLNLKKGLFQGPQILFEYVALQFSQMFKSGQLNPNIAVMFQMTVILGWSLLRLGRMIMSRLPLASILGSGTVFDIYNVTTLAAAGLLFYIYEGFHRTFTPSLLIVFLLLVTKKDYRFLVTLLVINLVFFNSYTTFYGPEPTSLLQADYTTKFPERSRLEQDVEKWVTFDRNSQDPWCNTLLIPLGLYDYRVIVVPPGIGISYIQNITTLHTPVKSKYLLLDRGSYEFLADRLHVGLLESLSIGDLYYNRDSGCTLHP